jgi:hypothetical protein
MKNLMLTDHIDGILSDSLLFLSTRLFFLEFLFCANSVGLGTSRKPEEMIEDWPTHRDQVILTEIREIYAREFEKSKFIIPFMAMECAASRVIESALALDRYLYLMEHENVGAAIVPIFDKSKSPRNLAIVGWKK